MSPRPAPLAWALLLSLLLHALVLAVAHWRLLAAPAPLPARPLAVVLPPLELKGADQPPLVLPQPAQAKPPKPALGTGRAAVRAAPPEEQVARALFYPPEAIAQGLEGETLVRLFLDESGHAVAARIEASSGHALLDEAALRAAKTVRTPADGTPREFLLPVRFRLR